MEMRNDLMVRIRESERRALVKKITYVAKAVIGIGIIYSLAVLFLIAFGA